MQMKIAIIQFPGSNCERETMLAVQRAGMEPVPFLWNEPHEKLNKCDGCIIVGGFSYEDRVRAGIISSLDPIMQTIRQLSMEGKPVLGICNGAQILVESGLVPGIVGYKPGIALAMNKRIKDGHILGTGFYNDWVYVKPTEQLANSAFFRFLNPEQPIYIPVSHGEGRFILAEGLLDKLRKKNISMLQYCDRSGQIKNEFPINPNGSEYNLAAICNTSGNVMAIMPHPERTPNGDALFHSMREYIAAQKPLVPAPLFFEVAKPEITEYKCPKNTVQLIIELVITDNAAVSLAKALQNLGLNIKVTRQTHWEITYDGDAQQVTDDIVKSFELFNPNKEKLLIPSSSRGLTVGSSSFLVQDKDNLIGKYKQEVLTKNFGITNITEIKQGTLWHITTPNQSDINMLLDKHILFNPCAHKCYSYNHA